MCRMLRMLALCLTPGCGCGNEPVVLMNSCDSRRYLMRKTLTLTISMMALLAGLALGSRPTRGHADAACPPCPECPDGAMTTSSCDDCAGQTCDASK